MKSYSTNKIVSLFTTDDGCRIAYSIDGDTNKPALVLSNSIATDFTMWDGQIENFSRYFQIIRFDTRGNGLSDAPLGDYSVDRMALDLIELLDFLRLDKVHFCGLSLGGFIGQWLGIHAPKRVDKLILSNTSPHIEPFQLWNNHIKVLRETGDMEPFERMFIEGWFPNELIESNKEIVEPFRKMIRKTTPTGLSGSYAAVRDSDFRISNRLILNKTLIIAGKYDRVTTLEHSNLIHQAISDSILLTLPVVHLSNVENKEVFEKSVLDFLLTS